jgi:hypothetical protein
MEKNQGLGEENAGGEINFTVTYFPHDSSLTYSIPPVNPCDNFKTWQGPVVHACNPSYSGGRDQENHGLKPAQANSSRDPILNTKPD